MPQIDAKNQLECWHGLYKFVKPMGSLLPLLFCLCGF